MSYATNGYLLNSASQCLRCSNLGTTSSAGTGNCEKCSGTTGNICDKCSDGVNPSTLVGTISGTSPLSGGNLVSAYLGSYLTADKKCNLCINNCLKCKDDSSCDICADGWYRNPSTATCTRCELSNCVTCAEKDKCTDCAVGYARTAFGQCVQCTGAGVVSCSSASVATQCADTYFLDAGTCRSCGSGCKKCLNTGSTPGNCVVCNAGQAPSAGLPTTCTDILVGVAVSGSTTASVANAPCKASTAAGATTCQMTFTFTRTTTDTSSAITVSFSTVNAITTGASATTTWTGATVGGTSGTQLGTIIIPAGALTANAIATKQNVDTATGTLSVTVTSVANLYTATGSTAVFTWTA